MAADAGFAGTVSFAGRVARPKRQPLPQRVGGFGGIAGLRSHLKAEAITHVIDATHPFAAQMSRNAIEACSAEGVPLIALTRPPWHPAAGDNWHRVRDVKAAVEALDRPACRVMLAVGRMHLSEFAPRPQHFYLLRLVDPPTVTLPLPDTHVIVDRGPFSQDADRTLMQEHRIDLVVSKNAGGTAAYAKIAAARDLGLPVLMIDRPALPKRHEAFSPDAVMRWLLGHETDLGV